MTSFCVLPQLPQLRGGEVAPVAVVDRGDVLLVVGPAMSCQGGFCGEDPVAFGASVWCHLHRWSVSRAVWGVRLYSFTRIHRCGCVITCVRDDLLILLSLLVVRLYVQRSSICVTLLTFDVTYGRHVGEWLKCFTVYNVCFDICF